MEPHTCKVKPSGYIQHVKSKLEYKHSKLLAQQHQLVEKVRCLEKVFNEKQKLFTKNIGTCSECSSLHTDNNCGIPKVFLQNNEKLVEHDVPGVPKTFSNEFSHENFSESHRIICKMMANAQDIVYAKCSYPKTFRAGPREHLAAGETPDTTFESFLTSNVLGTLTDSIDVTSKEWSYLTSNEPPDDTIVLNQTNITTVEPETYSECKAIIANSNTANNFDTTDQTIFDNTTDLEFLDSTNHPFEESEFVDSTGFTTEPDDNFEFGLSDLEPYEALETYIIRSNEEECRCTVDEQQNAPCICAEKIHGNSIPKTFTIPAVPKSNNKNAPGKRCKCATFSSEERLHMRCKCAANTFKGKVKNKTGADKDDIQVRKSVPIQRSVDIKDSDDCKCCETLTEEEQAKTPCVCSSKVQSTSIHTAELKQKLSSNTTKDASLSLTNKHVPTDDSYLPGKKCKCATLTEKEKTNIRCKCAGTHGYAGSNKNVQDKQFVVSGSKAGDDRKPEDCICCETLTKDEQVEKSCICASKIHSGSKSKVNSDLLIRPRLSSNAKTASSNLTNKRASIGNTKLPGKKCKCSTLTEEEKRAIRCKCVAAKKFREKVSEPDKKETDLQGADEGTKKPQKQKSVDELNTTLVKSKEEVIKVEELEILSETQYKEKTPEIDDQFEKKNLEEDTAKNAELNIALIESKDVNKPENEEFIPYRTDAEAIKSKEEVITVEELEIFAETQEKEQTPEISDQLENKNLEDDATKKAELNVALIQSKEANKQENEDPNLYKTDVEANKVDDQKAEDILNTDSTEDQNNLTVPQIDEEIASKNDLRVIDDKTEDDALIQEDSDEEYLDSKQELSNQNINKDIPPEAADSDERDKPEDNPIKSIVTHKQLIGDSKTDENIAPRGLDLTKPEDILAQACGMPCCILCVRLSIQLQNHMQSHRSNLSQNQTESYSHRVQPLRINENKNPEYQQNAIPCNWAQQRTSNFLRERQDSKTIEDRFLDSKFFPDNLVPTGHGSIDRSCNNCNVSNKYHGQLSQSDIEYMIYKQVLDTARLVGKVSTAGRRKCSYCENSHSEVLNTINAQLQSENSNFKSELTDLKFDLKDCLQKYVAPIAKDITDEQEKYKELQKELIQVSESVIKSNDACLELLKLSQRDALAACRKCPKTK